MTMPTRRPLGPRFSVPINDPEGQALQDAMNRMTFEVEKYANHEEPSGAWLNEATDEAFGAAARYIDHIREG